MNTIRNCLLIGLSALSLSSASFAAQAADTPVPGQSSHAAHFSEHMAKRQAMLHEKLKLSPAQEPAWTTLIAAAQPSAPSMRPDHAALAKMSAPQRLEQWIVLSQKKLASMEARLSALKTFYATLTPEQQKIMDDNVAGGGHGWHGWQHGHAHRQEQ